MIRRLLFVPILSLALTVAGGGVALACGGLVAPGHAEVLQKATTLVVWHGGFEHYITGFQFAGSANSFGYIIPLPGNPTKIQKGGDWTLERLEREVNPVPQFAGAAAVSAPAASARVVVLQQTKVGALGITVVRGGGPDVAAWAKRNGFDLTPDAPKVLAAYSQQGAVFALAKFDRASAAKQGLIQGQGEVIQFTIPAKAPWVPLRILALGKGAPELVDADVFVLTDQRPAFAPAIGAIQGMTVLRNEWANQQLLTDLRSDQRMSWFPATGMWFTALRLHTTAQTITYDLSINGGGPAGGVPFGQRIPVGLPWAWWLGAGLLVVLVARTAKAPSYRAHASTRLS